MRNSLWMKGLVVGTILLFVGTSVTSNISGYISRKQNDVLQLSKPCSNNVTITDWIEDVDSLDPNTKEWSIVTSYPDFDVDNIDIVNATVTQQGVQVTLSLRVAGNIENRWHDWGAHNYTGIYDFVEYDFYLNTTGFYYILWYYNRTCYLGYDNTTINLSSSNISVVNDTLTIIFSLVNANEICKELFIVSSYDKINFTYPHDLILASFIDYAPNGPFEKAIFIGSIHNVNITNDYISFNPLFMVTVFLSPYFFFNLSSNKFIMISKNYLGYIGQGIIIGLFKVDRIFPRYTESSNYPIYHRLHWKS